MTGQKGKRHERAKARKDGIISSRLRAFAPFQLNIFLWLFLLSTTFIVTPSLWNLTVTGKYFYFALAVAVATLFTAYRIIRKQVTLRICLTDVAVLCFAVWVGVGCVINGTHPGMKLWLFMLLVPLYVVIRCSLHDRNMARPLVWVILAVVTAEAVWGLLQLYGYLKSYHNLFAITGSFFNPGTYAGFLAWAVLWFTWAKAGGKLVKLPSVRKVRGFKIF